MAKLIREIMNGELLVIRPDAAAEEVLLKLLAFKVSGAPVVQATGELVGVVSWRDLVGVRGKVQDVMTAPVLSLGPDETVEAGALLLASSGCHRLIVVEGAEPVGVVSTQDVLRALIGFPVQHPRSFPHFDNATRLTWSDDAECREDNVSSVPQVEGLLVLVLGGAQAAEKVVWAEACENIQQHLVRLLAQPEARMPHLGGVLRTGKLRFRYAAVADITRRMTSLRSVLCRARDDRRADLARNPGAAHDVP